MAKAISWINRPIPRKFEQKDKIMNSKILDANKSSHYRNYRFTATWPIIIKRVAAVLALIVGLTNGIPAEAGIRYFDYQMMTINQWLPFGNPFFSIDQFLLSRYLNADGYVVDARGNGPPPGYIGYTDSGTFLSAGTIIGPTLTFTQGPVTLGYSYFGTPLGDWPGKGPGYLALKFIDADGAAHYGWAKIAVPANAYLTACVFYGYAYETKPNTPIRAGALSVTTPMLYLLD